MKKKFLLLYVLSFVLISCEDIKKEISSITGSAKSLNIICLVDFSGSIPDKTIEWYKNVISNTILSNMSEHDKLTVLPLDYGSLTSSVEIFDVDFKKEAFTRELDSPAQADRLKEKRLAEFREAQLQKFETSFNENWQNRKAYSRGTDIIGAMKQSLKYNLNKNDVNFLIVFSDMLNETEKLNHAKHLNSSRDIPIMLEKADKINLEIINVFIMTGEQPKISITKYDLLKEFWSNFISLCKGNLLEYSSGGESILLSHIHKTRN